MHSIFHSEHNRLVDANKATLLENATTPAGLAFLNEWLVVDVTALPADTSTLVWDGERLFQSARFSTEMQYQHLVFEEFARRIQPNVDPFIFNSVTEINPSIVAEFAHTVYRFGHSMLTGTVDRLGNDLNPLGASQETLLAAFLNPQMYLAGGATAAEINANLIRGLSRDVGNEMDEFIVSDVRSSLLGLPLDLAALNIARGRDTGIPSLNETRAQLYNGGAIDLKPYTSWVDFSEHLKNPLSIVNFIAAYGTHASILAATDAAGKRAAASALVDQAILNDNTTSGAIDFLNATGAYAGGSLGGLNDVDLWIGGLAEAKNEFGGMLGQTFNFIFEYQMEALQFGDRLYYLTRTQGTNFLNQLEPNTFSDLVMRNTDLGNIYSTHLNGALFVTPDYYFEMDRGIAQEDYNGAAAGRDVSWAIGEPHSALLSKVTRTHTGVVADGTHDVGGTFKFLGGEHVVVGGTEGNDKIWTDKGIDTIWGDGGNDYINAGTESDDVFGGEGDDIIEDPFGDDVLRGNQGNDVISSARGIDLLFGDEGNDFIMLGQDASEIFGGEGDDFILGGGGKDFLLGNEGNDWIEGGAGFDTIAGDNSELFFNSPVIGHDVLFNQGDEGDYDAESGDDIMGSGPSVFRYEGMFGFDWAIAKNDISGVSFDMAIPIFTTMPNDILKDRFDQVEALSGWKYNDILEGDDRGHKGGGSSAPDSVPVELFAEHLLTQEGINRINGFNEWFGGNANGTMDGTDARISLFGGASPVPGSTPVSTFRDGNILMGGDGNDLFRGRGGYDLIDGDAWLNVRIKIVHNGVTYSAESLSSDTTVMGQYAGKVFNTYTAADALINPLNIAGSPNFASPAFGGASLTSLMLTGVINPGSLSIVREILTDNTNVTGVGQNIDTVLFQGTMAEYEIEGLQTDGINYTGQVIRQAQDLDGDGFIFVRDKDTGAVGAVIQGLDANGIVIDVQLPSSRGLLTDDRDLLKNIEQLQFADRSFLIGGPNIQATGTVTIADPTPFDGRVTPYVGQLLPVSSVLYDRDNDANGDGDLLDIGDTAITNVTYEWQTTEVGNDAGWSTITTNANPYLVRGVDPGHILRAVATFTDKNGVTERVYSVATDNPTSAFSVNENSLTGVVVGLQIPFNVDYDSQSIGGNPPPDVDLARLHHEIDPTNNAGGRFTVVLNGVDFNGNPRYSLVVANGGPVLLDYEALQTPVDNQFQVVVNTYDAPGGTLVAVRQFTILLNDVVNESAPVVNAPTDINWNGVRPSDTALPLDGVVIANLSTVDVDSSPVTWSKIGGDARFTVTAAGNVSFTDPTAVNGLSAGQVYSLILKAEETANPGVAVTEAITIRTGTTGNNNGTFGLTALIGSGLTDIIYGLNGNDVLNGLGGNDTLFGQGGADTLNGGVGNDEMIGGTGNDTVNGGDGNDTIRYAFGDGNDDVDGGADSDKLVITGTTGNDGLDVVFDGTSLTGFESGSIVNIESVTADLGAGTLDLLDYGNTTANVTVNLGTGIASGFASIAGIEQVRGGDGDDTLTGGASGGDVNTLIGNEGDDTFFINDSADIVSESNGTAGGIDLVNATVSYTLTDPDVENLTLLGTADINGTGNASANVLTGNSGNNILNGAGGVDTASYANATAGVTVSLTTVGAQNTVGAGTDTLVSIENLTGSNQADTLTGNTVANVLSGGGGNDTLVATTDNVRDTLDGGAGTDTADYSTSTAGLTVNLGGAAPIVVGGTGTTAATSDVIVSVENITTGSGADTISGSNAVNTLNGGGGADIINGDGGADIIVGGAGTDTISGGTGQDTLTGGADKDTFVYATTAEASTNATNFDIITDFVTAGASSDIIDLSAIDAIQGLAGNQAFTFINSGIFTAPGQLRYVVSLGNTFIEGNVGGSTAADFRIQLSGVTTALGVEDFVL